MVNENTNGIITVNGHSYEDPSRQTENTNFALLVAQHFSEPFKDSNGYGESVARLSNMLGGGVIIQRFGVDPRPPLHPGAHGGRLHSPPP